MEQLQETNEGTCGTSDLTVKLGNPLSEETDVERLRADVEFLWQLLDDIDTATDMAKENDKWYRAQVERLQGKRHQRVTSDGYTLFVVPNAEITGAGRFIARSPVERHVMRGGCKE